MKQKINTIGEDKEIKVKDLMKKFIPSTNKVENAISTLDNVDDFINKYNNGDTKILEMVKNDEMTISILIDGIFKYCSNDTIRTNEDICLKKLDIVEKALKLDSLRRMHKDILNILDDLPGSKAVKDRFFDVIKNTGSFSIFKDNERNSVFIDNIDYSIDMITSVIKDYKTYKDLKISGNKKYIDEFHTFLNNLNNFEFIYSLSKNDSLIKIKKIKTDIIDNFDILMNDNIKNKNDNSEVNDNLLIYNGLKERIETSFYKKIERLTEDNNFLIDFYNDECLDWFINRLDKSDKLEFFAVKNEAQLDLILEKIEKIAMKAEYKDIVSLLGFGYILEKYNDGGSKFMQKYGKMINKMGFYDKIESLFERFIFNNDKVDYLVDDNLNTKTLNVILFGTFFNRFGRSFLDNHFDKIKKIIKNNVNEESLIKLSNYSLGNIRVSNNNFLNDIQVCEILPDLSDIQNKPLPNGYKYNHSMTNISYFSYFDDLLKVGKMIGAKSQNYVNNVKNIFIYGGQGCVSLFFDSKKMPINMIFNDDEDNSGEFFNHEDIKRTITDNDKIIIREKIKDLISYQKNTGSIYSVKNFLYNFSEYMTKEDIDEFFTNSIGVIDNLFSKNNKNDVFGADNIGDISFNIELVNNILWRNLNNSDEVFEGQIYKGFNNDTKKAFEEGLFKFNDKLLLYFEKFGLKNTNNDQENKLKYMDIGLDKEILVYLLSSAIFYKKKDNLIEYYDRIANTFIANNVVISIYKMLLNGESFVENKIDIEYLTILLDKSVEFYKNNHDKKYLFNAMFINLLFPSSNNDKTIFIRNQYHKDIMFFIKNEFLDNKDLQKSNRKLNDFKTTVDSLVNLNYELLNKNDDLLDKSTKNNLELLKEIKIEAIKQKNNINYKRDLEGIITESLDRLVTDNTFSMNGEYGEYDIVIKNKKLSKYIKAYGDLIYGIDNPKYKTFFDEIVLSLIKMDGENPGYFENVQEDFTDILMDNINNKGDGYRKLLDFIEDNAVNVINVEKDKDNLKKYNDYIKYYDYYNNNAELSGLNISNEDDKNDYNSKIDDFLKIRAYKNLYKIMINRYGIDFINNLVKPGILKNANNSMEAISIYKKLIGELK